MRKYAFAFIAILFLGINCYGQAIVTPRRHAADKTTGAVTPTAQSPAQPDALPSALPVSTIKIKAKIDGQVATVQVEHYFRNDTDEALEGTYYFPVPEGATLLEFAVYDGDERRVGRVKEKEEARSAYSAAVAGGEDPAILEMTKRGWFQSHVYPIPPRADKRIEVIYSQVLSEENDVYTFDYPLGRGYKKLKVPVGAVEIEIDLRSEVAIKNVFSPTHPLDINYDGDRHATCKTTTVAGGDAENFKLVYTLSNEEISASLITYREKGKDGYFLLMLAPKIEFDKKRISAKDVVFVIDVSYSMEGDKIKQAKEALRFGLSRTLNEGDRFNIIAFAGVVARMEPGLIKATPANIRRAMDYVDRLTLQSATNINDALIAAMGMVEAGNRAQNVVFITDGQPTASITDPNVIASNVRAANVARARLFTFGVGTDLNRLLLERLAAENRGGSLDIRDQSQLSRTLSSFFSMVSQPVLSDLQVDFGPVFVDRVQPAELPDLYTRTQIRIFGRYRNEEDLENVTIALAGRMSEQATRFELGGLRFPLFTTDKDFLPKLWATERVGALLAEIRISGERPELKQEVIDLAREFNLVTPYTSMYVPTTAEIAREKEQAREGTVDVTLAVKEKGANPQDKSKPFERLQLLAELPINERRFDRFAQAAPGAVVDSSGAAIAGATITIKDEKTGAERKVTTDAAGNYNIAGLPPGNYKIEVDAAGFKKMTVDNVIIQPGQTASTGVALSPGSVSETVTVTAAVPTVDTSASNITSNQESNKIRDLPALDPVYSFARLAPGSNELSKKFSSDRDAESRLQINGLPPRSIFYSLDGHNNNGIDGSPAVSINNFDAAETLHVATTRGTGDLTNTGAASINLITRSGTNEFHGTVFDYHLDSRLGALSPLERRSGLGDSSRLRSDIFGGTLGGPVIRNRAFFFGSFARETEESRRFFDSTSSQLTPTPRGLDALARAFPDSATVSDLARRGSFARSIGNPRATRTFSIPVLGVPVEFGEVARLIPSSVSGYEIGARFDFEISSRDRLQTSYWYDSRSVENAVGNLAAGYSGNHLGRGQHARARWTRLVSPRTTNELGFTFNRSHLSMGSSLLQDDSPLPSVSVGLRGIDYGDSPILPASQASTLFEVSEALTRIAGRHNLKLGGHLEQRLTGLDHLPGRGGHFSYAGFEDFILDKPTALVVAAGDARSRFRELRAHFFIDDAWRARSNLTVSLGLSYENANQPVNQLIDRLREREAEAATALFDTSLPLSLRAGEKVRRDNNNIAPRIGFAYTPRFNLFGKNLFGHDKTVIRGGASISYDQTAYRPIADVAASAPNVLLGVITPASVNAMPAFPHAPGASGLRASLGNDPRAYARTVIDREMRTPYSISWHLDASRDFDNKVSVGAAYVGARGAALIRAIDGSPVAPDLLAGASGPVRVYETSGRSIYHSFQARVDLKLANRFTGGVAYTWSKLIDNVPANNSQLIGGIASVNSLAAPSLPSLAQNPFNAHERALSDFDRRHRLAAHFVWDLPLRRNQDGVWGRLLGGWKASGIVEASSGSPFTPLQYFAPPASATLFASIFSGRLGALRPFAGNQQAPADRVAFSNAANALFKIYLNADGTAFSSPTGFIIADRAGFRAGLPSDARFIYNDNGFGDVGRNTLTGPRLSNIDFALIKTTKLNEKVSLQLRAEFFNLFNHPSRANPDSTIENAGGYGFNDLGEVDAAPRRARVALKLIF